LLKHDPPLSGKLGLMESLARENSLERQVSALLRRAGNPQRLAASPLMDAFCHVTGTRDAVAALEHVVDAAFDGGDPHASRLRSAILDVNFRRAATNFECARQNGISRRHFQRWRAQAVAEIARYARTILELPRAEILAPQPRPSAPAAAVRGPRDDAAWRFQRECEAYARARDRDNALEMRAIAANMLRVAVGSAARGRARASCVEAAVHLGRIEEATEGLQHCSSGARAYALAKLALLRGNAAEAEERASVASTALEREDRYRCLALISLARRVRGLSWRAPHDPGALPAASWERAAMELESAAHFACNRAWQNVQKLASPAQPRSEELGFRGIAAGWAAILSAAEMARGRPERARQWRARAVEHLLATQDRLLSVGLFFESAYDEETGTDALLEDVLYERLSLVVPQMLGDGAPQRAAVRELIRALFRLPAGTRARLDLEPVLWSVARSDSALVHYLPRCAPAIADLFALAVSAVKCIAWDEAMTGLRGALAESVAKLRPAAPRTIAVALGQCSKSQSAPANHLKADDQPSPGDVRSIESLADLRLRIVSVRSGPRNTLARSGGGTAARASC
jgi:hypothetical protein